MKAFSSNISLWRILFGVFMLLCVNFMWLQVGLVHDHSARDDRMEVLQALSLPTLTTQSQAIELPLCNTSQIIEGQWVKTLLPRVPYVSHHKHLRCYRDDYYEQTPYPTWSWQPHASTDLDKRIISDLNKNSLCRWTSEWNSTEFLRLTARSTVSIIGDSLSWEQYASLLMLLGDTNVKQKFQHWSKNHRQNFVRTPERSTARLVFRNDPYLRYIEDSVKNHFPMILVLNRGAHYVNDTTLRTEMQLTIRDLKAWYKQCQDLDLACHLIWRTTVPGHPKCNNETNLQGPSNDLASMEEQVGNPANYDSVTIGFHWQDFQRQNRLVVRLLTETAGAPPFTLLDAYPVNILRRDEHRTITNDCLHNCYPGKMDLYNQWLLHILKQVRKPADIARLEELFNKYIAGSNKADP